MQARGLIRKRVQVILQRFAYQLNKSSLAYNKQSWLPDQLTVHTNGHLINIRIR